MPHDAEPARRRVVFMGTPDFAAPTLQGLLEQHDVVGVFTQPDRPSGRGRRVRHSPVKALALAHDVPVFQPRSLRREPEMVAVMRDLSADVLVVAAYGLILPPDVLAVASGGALNVHASLLPRWRGAAPVNHALLAGDPETGVTIMLIDEGLDTGAMLRKRVTAIAEGDTAGALTERLALMGADLLLETLPAWMAGAITPEPQDDALATLAPRLSRADGRLDFGAPAAALARRVRALHPWPGTYTELPGGTRLKVHEAVALSVWPGAGTAPTAPAVGTLMDVDGLSVVATGEGWLRLERVQLAGKRAVTGADFLRGRPDVVGQRLGMARPQEVS